MPRNHRNRGARGPYEARSWNRNAVKDANPLRVARLAQRHTQQQAADLIGLKRARLCRIENGTLAPPRSRRREYPAYAAYVLAGTPAPAPKKRAKHRRLH